MPSKPIELAVARRIVEDMRAYLEEEEADQAGRDCRAPAPRPQQHYAGKLRLTNVKRLHTTKTVGLPHARGHGELYDGVA
jgi:hypothetical protein